MTPLLILLTVHFVADFVFQTDWMALNKSRSWKALLVHTVTYSAVFAVLGLLYALGGDPLRDYMNPADIKAAAVFAGITFLAHTIQDALTSRCTAALWKRNERHWFFVVIGFDQLLHAYQLAWTYQWVSMLSAGG